MAAERAWLEARERGDADALDSLLADEFVIIYPDGQRLHRQAALVRITSAATRWPSEYQTEGSKIHGGRPVVVLTGILNTHNRQHTSRLLYRDSWVWRDRRWQLLSSHLSAAPAQ